MSRASLALWLIVSVGTIRLVADTVAGTTCVDTDYYRACLNNDGSLRLLDRNTGVTVLSDSPRFRFNYGATTSLAPSTTNGSFELDANGDNIPDRWYVNRPYITLSTERASDGGKSLKFAATAPDIYRGATSPLMAVRQGATYTIGIDSFVSSYTSGWFRVAAYSYTTTNGSGKAQGPITATPDYYMSIPTHTGSWTRTFFQWTPPPAARSFIIGIFMIDTAVATAYFDNLSITVTDVYTSNGADLPHTITANGDITSITVTDDANPYVAVTHQYTLHAHSPYITYAVNLQYKQDVYVTEERFDFTVPSQDAHVMTRDLRLVPFDAACVYWSDVYTPRVLRFSNGLSFPGADTMQSMRVQADAGNTQVSFHSDYVANHPHFYYVRNGGGAVACRHETRRLAGQTYQACLTLGLDANGVLPYVVKTRQPYGYEAALTLTNHADAETTARIRAVAYGSADSGAPDYGSRGIVGRGIGWTKSVFVSGVDAPHADMGDSDFRELTHELYRDGVEIIAHTITPVTDSRQAVEAGLALMAGYHARNWIDHSANYGVNNWEGLAAQGAVQGDANYILDLLDLYSYRYAWSYIDFLADDYYLNMLRPYETSQIRPFLFYNNRVDDNPLDDRKIYLWSSINTKKWPDVFYDRNRVDVLIADRGIHIGHEYLGYAACENHAWRNHEGVIEIHPAFDASLQYMAERQANGLLWLPTMADMGDYLAPLQDVLVAYNADGSLTITNGSDVDLTGITLLTESPVRCVQVNGRALVSYGGDYGDKEIVLPTVGGGCSVLLHIVYGDKDASVPSIECEDASGNRLHDITGTWDSKNDLLTMTAQGRSGDYEFTVTIPSAARRIVAVTDVTANALVGNYQASDAGAITFPAHMEVGIHTFEARVDSDALTPAAGTTTPRRVMARIADRLEGTQVKVGVSSGIWPQEALYTGAIAAGMVDAYVRTGDGRYLASAELAGDYILTEPQWNFLGDEAYALMQLSRTSADPADNIWRLALETCYYFIEHDVGGTPAYLAGYGGTEPSTAVFYIAHHVVASYYVDAPDKLRWRQGLVDWLAQVDDGSAFYPVMAMGVATWALASTGPLDDTLIDPSGTGRPYWNLKRLSDLPGLLMGHQIAVGQPHAGGFYWRFDHTTGGDTPFPGGYTEDSIYGAMGLAAAAGRHRSLDLGGALSRARAALTNGVTASGGVLEHLVRWGASYYVYAGEMLQALAVLGGPGDVNLDNIVSFLDVAVMADCMREPTCVSCPSCLVADLDGDGDVDIEDLRVLVAWWLEEFGD